MYSLLFFYAEEALHVHFNLNFTLNSLKSHNINLRDFIYYKLIFHIYIVIFCIEFSATDISL